MRQNRKGQLVSNLLVARAISKMKINLELKNLLSICANDHCPESPKSWSISTYMQEAENDIQKYSAFSSYLLTCLHFYSFQRAKKVVSNSPGLVNSVFNLPDGQVICFEEFE